MSGLLEAALELAANKIAVFPITPLAKRPPLILWRTRASTDLELIESWWKKWPNANIGMPTGFTGEGRRSVEVLDVDIKSSGNGLEIADDLNKQGLLDGAFIRTRTPSGGLHFWFRSGGQSGSSVPSIDFKATGGYVLVPPSIVPEGQYVYIKRRQITREDQPFDFQKHVKPRFAVPESEQVAANVSGWVQNINVLTRNFLATSSEAQHNRNINLHYAACRAFEGGIRDLSPLFHAAKSVGLQEQEILSTIKSAARKYGIKLEVRERPDGNGSHSYI